MKLFFKLQKKSISFLAKHVEYNAAIHVLGGIGLGIIIASPYADPHPIRWALILLGLSLFGHLFTILN